MIDQSLESSIAARVTVASCILGFNQKSCKFNSALLMPLPKRQYLLANNKKYFRHNLVLIIIARSCHNSSPPPEKHLPMGNNGCESEVHNYGSKDQEEELFLNTCYIGHMSWVLTMLSSCVHWRNPSRSAP
uniref:Uncharacterized protein n=1 Tax=Opuntia streptacantha TaxID=393608 RepID=A0A7C9AU51_OPUST